MTSACSGHGKEAGDGPEAGRDSSPLPGCGHGGVCGHRLLYPGHDRAAPLPEKCSYIPGSLENYQAARADVEKVRATFHEKQIFYCFSATRENETTVLYQRLYGPRTLLFSLFWPTFLLTGGLLIIAMVKINQSLSILAAQK